MLAGDSVSARVSVLAEDSVSAGASVLAGCSNGACGGVVAARGASAPVASWPDGVATEVGAAEGGRSML